MKYVFLLNFVITLPLFSETSDTAFVSIDSLKDRTEQIFENWLFRVGDDTTWAKIDTPLGNWQIADSRLLFNKDSLKTSKWPGIGWFKKTIVIDSTLKNRMVGITLNHYGASEFYINGKLVNTYGQISKDAADEQIYYSHSKPIIVHFDSSSVYQFTVRYSSHMPVQHPYLYELFRSGIGFYMTVKSLEQALFFYGVQQADQTSFFSWLAGIFLAIAIIYFLLFLFYSKQKEYLYYTIFVFGIGWFFLYNVLDNKVYSHVPYFLFHTFVFSSTLQVIFISLVAFIYQIFYNKMLKPFYIFLVIGLAIYLMGLSLYWGIGFQIVSMAFLALCAIEILRVLVLAIKRKNNNAWVVGAGVFLFLCGFSIMFFSNLSFTVIYYFIFSVPLSMSIFLARGSSQTKKDLETQLIHVKRLSEEALEQEKKAAKMELEAQRVRQENERKSKELEEARQLQLSMLPKELPQLPHLDIAVYMQTATEVGGDYYDFNVSMDGTLTVVIGDATGHGMKAGTMVTTAKSLFKTHAANPDILFSFQEFSRCIKEMNFGRVSMCLTMLKISDHSMQIATAAMPPSYIYRSETKKVEEYQFEAMPLGAMRKFPYQIKETNLNPGDTILLLSDGLPELENKTGTMFGYSKIQHTFAGIAEKSADTIISHLKNEGISWVNNEAPDDDITFVVIKVK